MVSCNAKQIFLFIFVPLLVLVTFCLFLAGLFWLIDIGIDKVYFGKRAIPFTTTFTGSPNGIDYHKNAPFSATLVGAVKVSVPAESWNLAPATLKVWNTISMSSVTTKKTEYYVDQPFKMNYYRLSNNETHSVTTEVEEWPLLFVHRQKRFSIQYSYEFIANYTSGKVQVEAQISYGGSVIRNQVLCPFDDSQGALTGSCSAVLSLDDIEGDSQVKLIITYEHESATFIPLSDNNFRGSGKIARDIDMIETVPKGEKVASASCEDQGEANELRNFYCKFPLRWGNHDLSIVYTQKPFNGSLTSPGNTRAFFTTPEPSNVHRYALITLIPILCCILFTCVEVILVLICAKFFWAKYTVRYDNFDDIRR